MPPVVKDPFSFCSLGMFMMILNVQCDRDSHANKASCSHCVTLKDVKSQVVFITGEFHTSGLLALEPAFFTSCDPGRCVKCLFVSWPTSLVSVALCDHTLQLLQTWLFFFLFFAALAWELVLLPWAWCLKSSVSHWPLVATFCHYCYFWTLLCS